jgi:hypothetical protein
MTTELAMLIALMCPQTTLPAKVKCVASIRTCVQDPKTVVRKDNHIVFKCARQLAEKKKKKSTTRP